MKKAKKKPSVKDAKKPLTRVEKARRKQKALDKAQYKAALYAQIEVSVRALAITETLKEARKERDVAENRVARLRMKLRALLGAINTYALHTEHVENTKSFWEWKNVEQILENIKTDESIRDIFGENEADD